MSNRPRKGQMTKSEWHEVEIDVTIDVTDVIDFIEDYATRDDLEMVRNTLKMESPLPMSTLVDIMKLELFKKASEKYSLGQLEELLNLQYI